MKNLFLILVISMGMVQVSGQDVGAAAPDFEVNLLGSDTFKLSDQQEKVVFLFFFGNTCSSCKAVGPKVESSIYQAFKDKDGFVALGLDIWDSSSNESSVTGFGKSAGITFPLALKAGDVAYDYGTTWDRLLVIDRDGILVHKGGVAASNDLNNAIEAIEASLMTTGLSLETPGGAGVRVYPIPAIDVVHFESREAVSRIRIYDAAGKLVLDDADGLISGKSSLPVGELKRGLYFYSLQTEKGVVSGKLLIQR
ncbi:MAG: redoxin domain-containing protein [Bacteroidetes bacterium]|nr:redoxin domain-containing protein [Bacteroidota bacterium]